MLESVCLEQSLGNQILAQLPTEQYYRLHPHLEPVALPVKAMLCTAEEPVEYVYFLNTGMISLLTVMKDGRMAEAGVVGNEGMIGVTSLMGGEHTLNQAVVQIPGDALRINARFLQGEFERGGILQDHFLRFALTLYGQVSQTAACNCLHSIDERLARWLLVVRDRSHLERLELTHETMSQLLGVRRSSITIAACGLQRAGIIDYSRGKISILDQGGLEAASCECYWIIKKLYEHYSPSLWQAVSA